MNGCRGLALLGGFLLCSAGISLHAASDEEMNRLLAQPAVYTAIAAEADRQVDSGEFFDESAMKAVVAQVLGVDPGALPRIRLGPFPGEPVEAAGGYGAQSPAASLGSSDWQRALQQQALRPEVQEVLQETLLEHLRNGGRIAGGGHDEVILRKALSELPSGDLRRLLEYALPLPHDHVPISVPGVSDTLARMSSEDRGLLAQHHEVLADHGELLRQMPSWPATTRTAARRFLTLAREGAGPIAGSPADDVESPGFWDRTGARSRLDAYLGIVETRKLASSLGADYGRLAGRMPVFESAEFPEHRFEDFTDPSVGVFRMRQIPVYGTVPHTEVYVVPTTHGAIRILTDTAFGGPMVVEETRVDDERATPADSPGDYTIAGREASVSLVRYGEHHWETSVYAYDGETSFHVELGARLEGATLDHFVGFVRQLVESAR